MKAQGYEINSRERKNKPKTRIMNFNLLSVADTDLLLCKLDEDANGEVKVSVTTTDSEVYIASYIIDRKEVIARINFVRFNALEPVIKWFNEMHEFNVGYFEDLIDQYYADPFKSSASAQVLRGEFVRQIGLQVNTALRKLGERELEEKDYDLSKPRNRDVVSICLPLLDPRAIEKLNANEALTKAVRKAMQDVYRYHGPFEFELDIPF